jgi:hypothetical protein
MKVITAVINNPIFIEMQYYTLKKHMKCDYEFIVFNDAKNFPDFSNGNDIHVKQIIVDTCNKLGIQCINIPNERHKIETQASIRTADSMNYILKYQRANPDKYLLIDSDMFLIDDFHIDEFEKYNCAFVLQTRYEETVKYFWNGIYFLDINKMTNLEIFNWNCSPGCDTGGMTHKWFNRQQDKSRIYFIKYLQSCTWDENDLPEKFKKNKKLITFLKEDPRNIDDKYFCEIYEDKFFHYRAGGNWEHRKMKDHVELTYKLKDALL